MLRSLVAHKGGNWSGSRQETTLSEISERSALLREHITRAQRVCWMALGVLSTDLGLCCERSRAGLLKRRRRTPVAAYICYLYRT